MYTQHTSLQHITAAIHFHKHFIKLKVIHLSQYTTYFWIVADDKKGPSGENNNCDEEEGSDDSDYDEPNDEWLKEPQKTPQQKRRTLPLPRKCQVLTSSYTRRKT